MVYPTFSPGRRLLASQLRAMQMQSIEQGIELVSNNNSTFLKTSIVVPVPAGASFWFWLVVGYTSHDASGDSGGFKYAWISDDGIIVRQWAWGLGDNGSGASANDFTSVNFAKVEKNATILIGAVGGDGLGGGTTNSFYQTGLLVGDAEKDGEATFEFAQHTAGAFDSSITGSSRIEYIRIG